MKLSKIYSNNKNFEPIIFNKDINFILSSDHSVGKSTLFYLIDFCLLASKGNGILKREEFIDFIFYLELKFNDFYITIKRSTQDKSNISIKKTNKPEFLMDCEKFDKTGDFDKIKDYLNDKLNFRVGNFRDYLSYFLRDQDNQSDVFRLNKFIRSKDIFFKPVVANLLSIDGKQIKEKYEIENNIKKIKQEISWLGENLKDYTTKEKIEAELSIYKQQLKEKDDMYKKFDFYLSEKNISQELINNIEKNISNLNKKRNSILRELNYIDEFINQNITVKEDDLSSLFEEMKILFPNDLRKNYQNVIDFNKQLAEERTNILNENKVKFIKKLKSINKNLEQLNNERIDKLSILENTDSVDKFKQLQKDLISLNTEINMHNDRLKEFNLIEDKKAEISSQQNILNNVIERNKKLIKTSFIDKFKIKINKYSNIIFGKDAAFSVGFNKNDNIEFSLKLISKHGFNNELEKGNTIKKLLCFVFSAAILEMYKDDNFFHFFAFDSPFDGDKNEWQEGTFNAIKELSKNKIQVIITSIEDVISPVLNMDEIKTKTVRFLSDKDKLLGSF